MNKISLIVFACLFITGSIIANANPPDKTSRLSVSNKGSLVKVFYRTEYTHDVKVRILDKTKKEVFAETISKTDGFIRPYNFSNLPAGNYTIQIRDGNSIYEEKISTIPSDQRLFHILPMKDSEGKYLLMAGKKAGTTINVRVIDQDNTIVFEKAFSSERDFSQVINTANVKGPFSIEVSDSSGAFKSYSYK